MPLDLASIVYLDHEQNLAFKAITRRMRYIHSWYKLVSPEHANTMLHIIDIMESWKPLGAGEGSLSIYTKGLGGLDVFHREGVFSMQVAPNDILTGEPADCERALWVVDYGEYWLYQEAMAFASRILGFVNLRYKRYGEIPEISCNWTQLDDRVPGTAWVALREKALKGGYEAPRASHWMSDLQ